MEVKVETPTDTVLRAGDCTLRIPPPPPDAHLPGRPGISRLTMTVRGVALEALERRDFEAIAALCAEAIKRL